MTPALRAQVQSVQTARKMRIPEPFLGWNARDPIAAQKPGDAYQMDNWICRPGYAEIRKGYAEHVVDFSDPVESLIPYRAGDAEELFAAAGDSFYDVTAAGALGAPVLTGLSNARWQFTNIANDAGVFVIAVNGADTPKKYDGSSWTDTVITGTVGSITLDPTTLINAMLHKRRLFLQEKDSLRVWFLDPDAIAGAAGLLDLGPVFKEGGSLVGMGVWSGIQDVNNPIAAAAFITDQGEVAIYRGNDPTDSTDWFLDGVYTIGKPLGLRAVFNTQSDLIIITYDGAIPLSVARAADRTGQKDKAITSRIQNAFAVAATAYGSKFGWEAILYPSGQLAMINVPVTELGRSKQFVQSTQTGGWSQFIGLNAVCWAYVNGQIFFGGVDGSAVRGVYRWDTGGSDNGTMIQCDLITSFQDFGVANMKNFTMLRPILRAASNVRPYVDMLVDYRITQPTDVPDSGGVTGSGVWGQSLWGVGTWGSSKPLRLDWTTVGGIGYVGAARIRVLSNPTIANNVYPTIRCELIGYDGLFTTGGALG